MSTMMNMKRFRRVSVGSVAMVIAALAHAEFETYRWEIELENLTGFQHLADGQIDAPQFDDEKGTRQLRTVRLRFDAAYEFCFRIENTGDEPGFGTVWTTIILDLTVSGEEVWGPPYGRGGGGPHLNPGESFDWCSSSEIGAGTGLGRAPFVGDGTVPLDYRFGLDSALEDPESFDIEFLNCTCPIVFGLTLEYCFTGRCPADITGDGEVSFDDLLALLDGWGDVCTPCTADLDCDSDVDLADLLVLLAAWGPCEP